MTVDITSNTTETTTTAADVPQTSEEQTSPLPSGKGRPDRCLNARLLSKFGGDVALVEKHLEKMRRNREGKRADILAAFGPSVEILTQRGFGDHPRLPWLLKKFEGDAEKIIERIQNNANKKAVAGGAGRGVCRKIPRSPASASPSSSSSSSSSSDLSPSSTESLSSDATPSLSFPSSSSSSSAVSDIQEEIATATPEEPKESRKAKMQMIKQQIKDLQAQMKEMQTENAAQIQLRVQKRKQRLERLHDQEAQILEKIATLKQKASNTNDKIQRHEQQLERVRGVIAKLSAGPLA